MNNFDGTPKQGAELAAGQYLSRNLQFVALQRHVPGQILGAS